MFPRGDMEHNIRVISRFFWFHLIIFDWKIVFPLLIIFVGNWTKMFYFGIFMISNSFSHQNQNNVFANHRLYFWLYLNSFGFENGFLLIKLNFYSLIKNAFPIYILDLDLFIKPIMKITFFIITNWFFLMIWLFRFRILCSVIQRKYQNQTPNICFSAFFISQPCLPPISKTIFLIVKCHIFPSLRCKTRMTLSPALAYCDIYVDECTKNIFWAITNASRTWGTGGL